MADFEKPTQKKIGKVMKDLNLYLLSQNMFPSVTESEDFIQKTWREKHGSDIETDEYDIVNTLAPCFFDCFDIACADNSN
jgi:hypothetical protein